MKKAIMISLTLLAAAVAAPAQAAERPLTVLLPGGPSDNVISIKLSADGRSYVIESNVTIEVHASSCTNSGESQIVCEAPAIGGFEVNGEGGNDAVTVAREVPVAVTLRGGVGDDRLLGGAAADKLTGGSGADVLVGRGGADWLYGGAGDDKLAGGSGGDLLRGGSGLNALYGGSGHNDVF